MHVAEFSTPQERKEMSTNSDFYGWLAVIFDWAIIALAMTAAGRYPNPLTILVAIILIGGRQLGLGILVHECVHRSLFRTRALNDFAGKWFCGAAIWQDLPRYREHHLKHHQWAGTATDPDTSLVAAFPVTRASLARKFLRDLTGITGLKRLYGLFMMDAGIWKYTIAAEIVPLDQTGRSTWDKARSAFFHMIPMLIANAFLFAIFFAVGKPWLYLLWIGSYLTTFSLFLRIRSIAEHGCTEQNPDPRLHTRTTLAGFFERATIAPHRVHFHIEHHILMSVPYFRLRRFHKALAARGVLDQAYISKSYAHVLQSVTKR